MLKGSSIGLRNGMGFGWKDLLHPVTAEDRTTADYARVVEPVTVRNQEMIGSCKCRGLFTATPLYSNANLLQTDHLMWRARLLSSIPIPKSCNLHQNLQKKTRLMTSHSVPYPVIQATGGQDAG